MEDASATVSVDLDMSELLGVLKHYNDQRFSELHLRASDLLAFQERGPMRASEAEELATEVSGWFSLALRTKDVSIY